MIAERLRAVRKTLGKSQKAFATELGLSLSGLQGYEAGTFAPGCSVLEALCRIGVDTNWLLTGEGTLWRPGCAPSEASLEPEARQTLKLRDLPAARRRDAERLQGESVKDVALQIQDEAWKRLDFGMVALLASQGRQELAWHIMTLLVTTYPRGYTVAELLQALGKRLPEERLPELTSRDVAAQLVAMSRQRAIVEVASADGVQYRAASPSAHLLMSNVGDRNQALEKAVETLVRDVLPATELRSEGGKPLGRIMNIHLNLPAGKALPFVRHVTDLLAQTCVEAGQEDGPDAMVVVIGAAALGETP